MQAEVKRESARLSEQKAETEAMRAEAEAAIDDLRERAEAEMLEIKRGLEKVSYICVTPRLTQQAGWVTFVSRELYESYINIKRRPLMTLASGRRRKCSRSSAAWRR
eukprot:1176541-Prorocentrum_minimum.AAC.2